MNRFGFAAERSGAANPKSRSIRLFGLFVLFPGTQDVSGSVDDGNNVNLVGFDMIDDAVRPLHYFTNLIHVVFRNTAS